MRRKIQSLPYVASISSFFKQGLKNLSEEYSQIYWNMTCNMRQITYDNCLFVLFFYGNFKNFICAFICTCQKIQGLLYVKCSFGKKKIYIKMEYIYHQTSCLLCTVPTMLCIGGGGGVSRGRVCGCDCW